MAYIVKNKEICWINLYVQPGARKSELAGLFDGVLKIRIKARAIDGMANKELLRFFRKDLGLKSADLVSGLQSRYKKMGLSLADLEMLEKIREKDGQKKEPK